MRVSEAKQELAKIMRQKTVRITRLRKVLQVLNYFELERKYINAGKVIKKQRERLRYLELKGVKKEDRR